MRPRRKGEAFDYALAWLLGILYVLLVAYAVRQAGGLSLQ